MLFSLLIILGIAYLLHLSFIAAGNMTDWQISLYRKLGLMRIDNYQAKALQPNSLDVHLARSFARQKTDGDFETFEADYTVLAPGDFILATTQEYFYFPRNIHGVLQGKSSWARLGLYVESAGLFDSGFQGEAVVELTNQGNCPLTLRAGTAIAQMIFYRNLPVLRPYGKKKHSKSNYQGQTGATQSALQDVLQKDLSKLQERLSPEAVS